jgi:hypothetical protein
MAAFKRNGESECLEAMSLQFHSKKEGIQARSPLIGQSSLPCPMQQLTAVSKTQTRGS